ncbi:hypothetical protein D3C80_1312670 [compost metagenome]
MSNACNAAIGFHGIDDFVQHLCWYGVATLRIRRRSLSTQLFNCLAFFRAQLAEAVAKEAIKCGSATFTCFRIGIRRIVILLMTILSFVFINVALILTTQLVFTGNAHIKRVQLRLGSIPLSALLFSPGRIANFIVQGTHIRGDGVTFLLHFVQFHDFSLRVKKSQQALAPHTLINGLRQRAAVARFLPGFHGSNA